MLRGRNEEGGILVNDNWDEQESDLKLGLGGSHVSARG